MMTHQQKDRKAPKPMLAMMTHQQKDRKGKQPEPMQKHFSVFVSKLLSTKMLKMTMTHCHTKTETRKLATNAQTWNQKKNYQN